MVAQHCVHVAVGVIVNEQQQVLIAKRADHLHQGGLWEFPGGKVESGERVEQALARELYEELGLQVDQPEALMEVRHDYGDKSVLLDVWLVREFSGVASGREGQPIVWAPLSRLGDYAFPAANQPIIDRLAKARLQRAPG